MSFDLRTLQELAARYKARSYRIPSLLEDFIAECTAAPAQRDAGEKLRLTRRIETAIANRNDAVFDAIKAALLAEGSKP